MNGWEIASSVATMVTALAVLLAVGQLIVARQQSHREFESLYVQRYWDLMDSFSDHELTTRSNGAFRRRDHAAALRHVQLCEDQADMRRLGRITENTWKIWAQSIASELTSNRYTRIFSDRTGEFVTVRQFLKTGVDPYTGSRLWARLNGL